MKTFLLDSFPLDHKTIFLRTDFNVPIHNGKVLDNFKITATLPTIKHLLQRNCKIIIATHLGRPPGRIVPELKIAPITHELRKLLPGIKITMLSDCLGAEVRREIQQGKPREMFVLENLKFYREEMENDPLFAHTLCLPAEVYVNDAFASIHHNYASLDAITHFLPAIPGFLMQKEVHYFSHALHPHHPAVWIMGGAKLHKINVIKHALKTADTILVGGALAFAFLKAKKIPIGMSAIDSEAVKAAQQILQLREAKKLFLPLDFVTVEQFAAHATTKLVPYNTIQPREMALDVGPQTVALFQHHLRHAKTIIWNGPLGYCEWAKFAHSTKELAQFVGKTSSTVIAGGGETSEILRKLHLEHNITHLSTGGGAVLAFLSGEKLPGIYALEHNFQKFKKKIPHFKVI